MLPAELVHRRALMVVVVVARLDQATRTQLQALLYLQGGMAVRVG